MAFTSLRTSSLCRWDSGSSAPSSLAWRRPSPNPFRGSRVLDLNALSPESQNVAVWLRGKKTNDIYSNQQVVYVQMMCLFYEYRFVILVHGEGLTWGCSLFDSFQHLLLHSRVVADLFPGAHNTILIGPFCQLLLIGYHKADHVALFTGWRTTLKK